MLLDETRDRRKAVKMYQTSDIYVLHSYRECLPLTLFEAMASGLPIVASPVNCVPYEMREPENNFLADYGSNKGFKKRINELLNHEKLRKRISRNNLKKAKAYRWDNISEKIIKLYKSLIETSLRF